MRKDKPCVLKVEDVTMQFGGVVAVNNFSMQEYEGEIVAIIGPNGIGKSTLHNRANGTIKKPCIPNETSTIKKVTLKIFSADGKSKTSGASASKIEVAPLKPTKEIKIFSFKRYLNGARQINTAKGLAIRIKNKPVNNDGTIKFGNF